MEAGFFGELVGLVVWRDEGAGYLVGAQPGGGDVDPVLVCYFDVGEVGELLGCGAGWGACEGKDAMVG